MKKTAIALLMLGTVLNLWAQEENTQARERLLEAKIDLMISTLDITAEQKQKFTEVYRRYNEKMRSQWSHAQPQHKSQDVKQEAERIKHRLNNQKKAIEVQLSFTEEFANILTAKQLRKLWEVERKLQSKVRLGKHNRLTQERADRLKAKAERQKARAAERRARTQERKARAAERADKLNVRPSNRQTSH